MRIQITAKGLVSVSTWNDEIRVNDESLSKRIADAVRSIEGVSSPFATVTVELIVQEPVSFVTAVNGVVLGSEKGTANEEEKTE